MSTAAGTSGVFDRGAFRVQLGNAGVAAGDVASVLNPLGEDLIVTYCAVNVTTIATGAATIDVGCGSSASTSYDNLLDAQDVHVAGAYADLGTNGKRAKLWAAAEYLTASEASGDVAGLVGELIVKFVARTSAGAPS